MRLAPLSRAVLEAGAAAGADAQPTVAGLGMLVARGTRVWAKHGSDGLWHRGVVQSPVDADCYSVQFTERHCVDVAWCAAPLHPFWGLTPPEHTTRPRHVTRHTPLAHRATPRHATTPHQVRRAAPVRLSRGGFRAT